MTAAVILCIVPPMRNLLLALALLVLAAVAPAHAATCTVTSFPASGTLTAAALNSKFGQVTGCINGNLGNSNWNSSEQLALGNLVTQNAIYAQSFTIGEVYNAADITTSANMRVWSVPVTSTIIGMTIQPHGCAACNATVTLQKDAATIKVFTVAAATFQSDFTISSSATNAQQINIDLAGTITGIKSIDIVVYTKAPLQI